MVFAIAIWGSTLADKFRGAFQKGKKSRFPPRLEGWHHYTQLLLRIGSQATIIESRMHDFFHLADC